MKKEFSIVKTWIQNFAIFMLIVSGISHILLALPIRFKNIKIVTEYYANSPFSIIIIRGILSAIVGFVLLLLSVRLFRRMRFAWVITVITLSLSVFLYLAYFHGTCNLFVLCELFIIAVLIFSYKDFCKRSDRISVKAALSVSCVSIFLVVLNTAIGLFALKNHYVGISDFGDCLFKSFNLLFLMDTSAVYATTKTGILYAKSAIALNWTCLIFSLFLILKPLVYNPIVTRIDKEKAHRYINTLAHNPISYLAIEDDKKYFFSASVDGVIAYCVASDVAVCVGDIICAEDDGAVLLSEFMLFCAKNTWDIVFIETTDRFLELYKTMGFGVVKYGDEAMFKLSEYNLNGGKIAKVRAAINHATKAEIVVKEYKPLIKKNIEIEKQIEQVSKQWLSTKKSGKLSFMIGGVGLEKPMERRYFIAEDENGVILGFVVFIPFDKGNGYFADVTRRRPTAPQGVIEKIIYEAFMKMKDEEIEWGSMGLAPLANICDGNNPAVVERLLDFVYENMNNMYGFKALHHAKAKYAPTEWQPRYLVYHPPVFNAKIAYSIIKAQNPKGISNFIFTQLKQRIEKSKD